ncbi:MAG: hypothetical protein H7X80_02865 [bacterium]|nr:hypothetical protein [Candidatus Kapabacteria bacterium]
MKRTLMTMLGIAAIAMPALAQSIRFNPSGNVSAAPQVEIPEGAYEIALPNLVVVPTKSNENTSMVPWPVLPANRARPAREKALMRMQPALSNDDIDGLRDRSFEAMAQSEAAMIVDRADPQFNPQHSQDSIVSNDDTRMTFE